MSPCVLVTMLHDQSFHLHPYPLPNMLKEILNHNFLVNIFTCILKCLLIDSFSIWGATLSLQINLQRKTFKYGLAER